ncbi:hypothetical protein CkaCkLH20_05119 [Colletotrichum karsti]|uniref:Rhodopsin domain-containing protein n=1 Tax=Colletotrichum karsti TaxID=1095194 RepID=A0A9P6I7J2_9PEZI|nr:uncharacterized protein CkaCkLH20_05119 [Colletotrichum karsti]KAF9877419.1 hypothetical protein CkaCkLH20_05119 [Colletotrichum karsti]
MQDQFVLQRDGAVSSMPTPKNYGDPSVLINAPGWSMLAVSTIFLFLRIYCKGFRVRWMVWLDDWLLVAGWAFLIASQALLSELMRLGFARTYNVTPTMSTFIYSWDNCHKVALALTKTSFAVTLHRIASPWQKYVIWFLVGTMNLQFVVHIILTWRAICKPPGHEDHNPHLPLSCWQSEDAITLGIFGGFYSALSDFILALLPWKIVLGLQMKKHEKIGVAVAMSMGVLAGVMGVMKAVQSIVMLDTSAPDLFWKICIMHVWAMAEPNVTIIAACIPVLRVLVRHIRSTREAEYPSSGAYIRSDNLSKFQNQSMPGGRSRTVNHHDPAGNDTDSDRSMLPQGIVRTTEVTIDYDKRSGRSGNSVSVEEEIELADR